VTGALEALACDTHLHVFGPPRRYPLRPGVTTAPWQATLDAYREIAAQLGLGRQVLVQPSLYGPDNSCLLDALETAGPGRARGVVQVDDAGPGPADRELARWHALGVRGLRVNCFPLGQARHGVRSPMVPEPGWADAVLPGLARQAALARELGWHLDLLAPGWLVAELLPALRGLPVSFVLAHLGMFPAEDGPGQPGFRALLGLMTDGSGRCWVKLSGPYRISRREGFTDVVPMAQALLAAAPDRVLWGSDYPHLSWTDEISPADMMALLGRLVPDPVGRARVLVRNPALLYGFDPGEAVPPAGEKQNEENL
jgi:2-pyrone-4,6-dicarboxylate lactonase